MCVRVLQTDRLYVRSSKSDSVVRDDLVFVCIRVVERLIDSCWVCVCPQGRIPLRLVYLRLTALCLWCLDFELSEINNDRRNICIFFSSVLDPGELLTTAVWQRTAALIFNMCVFSCCKPLYHRFNCCLYEILPFCHLPTLMLFQTYFLLQSTDKMMFMPLFIEWWKGFQALKGTKDIIKWMHMHSSELFNALQIDLGLIKHKWSVNVMLSFCSPSPFVFNWSKKTCHE